MQHCFKEKKMIASVASAPVASVASVASAASAASVVSAASTASAASVASVASATKAHQCTTQSETHKNDEKEIKHTLYFPAFAASKKGTRETMEDTYISGSLRPDIRLYAVMDGHGGHGAVEYLSKHLVSALQNLENPMSGDGITKALFDLESQFFSKHKDDISGTTLAMAIVKRKSKNFKEEETKRLAAYEITIVNIGDSRVYLVPQCGDRFVTRDHRPTSESEYQRIVAAGGFVNAGRVDGNLETSRSFGDSRFKTNSKLSVGEQKVVCTPAVSLQMATEGDVLILMTDGVVNSFKTNTGELSRFMNLSVLSLAPHKVLLKLIERAKIDDATAIVVSLDEGLKFDLA